MMDKLFSIRNGVQKLLAPLVALATRLVLGKGFYDHGLQKFQNLDGTIGFFKSKEIPMPEANAYIAAAVELVGGICLILGLGTRISSLLLAFTMVVAIVTAHPNDFMEPLKAVHPDGLFGLLAFIYLLLSLVLLAWGPGPLSIDGIFARNRK